MGSCTPNIQNGVDAYAHKQADIYCEIVILIASQWLSYFDACGLGTKWMAGLLWVSSDTIFARIFRLFLTQLHFTFLTPPFSLMLIFVMLIPLMLSCSRTDDKNTIRLVQLVTEQLIYWATDILKQSCCGSSSPGSCAGTSSAATEHSHHSKFRTSQTRSTSRSASTA